MSEYKDAPDDPIFLEQCNAFFSLCIQTMLMPKSSDKYQEQMNKLAQSCGNLIKDYPINSQSLAAQMKEAMTDASDMVLEKIENRILELKDIRTHTRNQFFGGENQIRSLTEQINLLEKRKTLPYEKIIQDIIYDSFHLAVAKGFDIPDLSTIESTYSSNLDLDAASPKSSLT